MSGSASKANPAPYQPNKRTLGELLSMTSPPLVVPNWQRNYSWTLSHVETFWSDLVSFEKRAPENITSQYFLGSVVIVESSADEHLLLDGQQRLATSAILLSVIRERLKEYKGDAAQRLQSRYLADFDDAKDETIYKLTLNAYDREFFRRKVLQYRDSNFEEPEAVLPSHRMIASAREYFEGVFAQTYARSKPEKAFAWALRIQNVLLNHMTVIAVTSTDEDAAAEVFETLNDRGIGLSTPDLLRNLVMRRAAENDRETIVDLWRNVIEFESDGEIKAFLRHFWISHYGDVKTQSLYREIKSNLTERNVKSLDFSRTLSDAADVYRDIKQARDDEEEIEVLFSEVAELGAGASILYPVLLSIAQSVDKPAERVMVMRSLLNLYVRHSVISLLENSKLENVIYKEAAALRRTKSVANAIEAFAAACPDDETTINAFRRLSVSHNSTRRYLLTKLEMSMRATEEMKVASPSKVHVEHIYPQTPEEGMKWANHTQALNRMGNLTLLSARLNKTIRNSGFEKKKPHYEKSELHMTRNLAAKWDKWSFAAVEERQEVMAADVPKIWPIIGKS